MNDFPKLASLVLYILVTLSLLRFLLFLAWLVMHDVFILLFCFNKPLEGEGVICSSFVISLDD
jgi:hypothetical protein